MTESIELLPHVGKQPVTDSAGNVLSIVDVPTGLQMVVHRRTADDGTYTQRQIGFLHPNAFMHFIIPDPPKVFSDWVKREIETLTAAPLRKVGAPPAAEEE